jgi:hypothetical protein
VDAGGVGVLLGWRGQENREDENAGGEFQHAVG